MWSSFGHSFKDIHTQKSLPQDVAAGLTVAAVALPLNLALAVASGLPPSAGLVAGAIGGLVAGFVGGAPIQVTGPAAALASIVAGIALGFGPVGVALAAVMVGVFQLILGFTRAGGLMKHVPESVLAGFTTGVGLKLLFGEYFLHYCFHYLFVMKTFLNYEFGCGKNFYNAVARLSITKKS